MATIRERLSAAMKSTKSETNKWWTRTTNSKFLDAMTAAMALMIAADGKIEPSEIDGAMEFMTTDETMQNWDMDTRTHAFQTRLEKAGKGPIAQAPLFGDIAKLKGTAEAETLLQLVAALSAADGEVAADEVKMFNRIAVQALGKTQTEAKAYLSA